ATPVRLYALNVIDWMHLNSIEPFKSSLLAIPAETQSKKRQMKNEKLATATYEGDMRHYLLGMKDESRSAERELP
ncbi:MAG: hypothetical protein ACXWIU_11145, partial [Limisphaerales bacterium]